MVDGRLRAHVARARGRRLRGVGRLGQHPHRPGRLGTGALANRGARVGRSRKQRRGALGLTHAEELGGREFVTERRPEAEVGYELAGPWQAGVVTPYAGLSLAEAGNRTWRIGARWQVAPEIALGLEASGAAGGEGDADNSLMLRAYLSP